MDFRKEDIRYTYDKLNERIASMESNDPKRDKAKEFLDLAKDAIDELGDASLSNFETKEEDARAAINKLNKYLVLPFRPGMSVPSEGAEPEGGVPEGDIVTDFIPQAIRLLFRFASLGILVSFVVSGVMFIISFDNEERTTKAKQMLYYTLVGFAFITLAFAIVKAVSDIDFFGFF